MRRISVRSKVKTTQIRFSVLVGVLLGLDNALFNTLDSVLASLYSSKSNLQGKTELSIEEV